MEKSLGRLVSLLDALGVNAADCIRHERLIPAEGDLADRWPDLPRIAIGTVIHGAASTRFHADGDGEPYRTNVSGTRRLLEWAAARSADDLHLVSSAYTCGRTDIPVSEQFVPEPPAFHNPYEESKWQAERLCVEWAASQRRRLTIHRPSVVVGEFGAGRASKFSGFYVLARATEILDRIFRDADAASRQSIPLRIRARPDDRQNIVPVDYVASMMAHIIGRPHLHGRVYHLVHPNPPTNDRIKRAFEEQFGIGGGRFVAPETFDADDLNEHEQRFYEISRSIEHYFVDTPTFLRPNADAVEEESGTHCPTYDAAAIRRLVAYAQRAEWGRPKKSERDGTSPVAAYFESFLPTYVSKSEVARLTAVSTTMRFVIDDEPNGQWVCRFDRGQLEMVHRGEDGVQEDFGYRATRDVFWEAIGGKVHPQELFLSGRAEVFGDVEQALKMAMILHAFTREWPCDAHTLARVGARS
jgi:nucleoside-diphosphate-sugar epimerase